MIRPQAPVAIGEFADLVRACTPAQAPTVPSLAEWQAQAGEVHRRFWEARHLRDEGIVRVLERLQPGAFQAGLFDRRAEREQAGDILNKHHLLSAATLRRTSTRRLATFDGMHTRSVLVLVPAHLLSTSSCRPE
jgi:hypothetical protein